MVTDDSAGDIITNLIRARLQELKRVSGLPIVFGGATRAGEGDEQVLVIEHLAGTVGDALRDLQVPAGRGLGGATLVLGKPKLSISYRDDESISHEFDIQVVEREQISSVFAFPVRVRGEVEGVFYGAVRDRSRIGDDAIRAANGIAFTLERELGRLLRPGGGLDREATGPVDLAVRHRLAVAELTDIIDSLDEGELRQRLERVRADLGGGPRPRVSSSPLTSRELDALRLAAVGATNAEIASELGLKPQTIKAYMRNVMRKLEVHNRSAAVHVARSTGVL